MLPTILFPFILFAFCYPVPSEVNGISNSVTDQELKTFSSDLLKIDSNKASVVYHTQGKQHSSNDKAPTFDLASQPLFETIPDNILKRTTYSRFIKLLDNYERRVEVPETVTAEEQAEMDNFLKDVTSTQVMQKAKKFLTDKGLLNQNANFQDLLSKIWFHQYSRGGNVQGSSGFEHVFVGEIKHRAISGLHNWLRFYLLERAKAVNYEGFLVHLTLDPPVTFLKYKFSWDRFTKPVSSMFIGTSPEFEMALYTVCFYARPNRKCPVLLGKKTLSIHAYTLDYKGETYIGSAYPSL